MKGSSSPGILVTPCSLRTSSQIRDRELSTALAPDCRQSDALLIFSYFLSQQKAEPLLASPLRLPVLPVGKLFLQLSEALGQSMLEKLSISDLKISPGGMVQILCSPKHASILL